jgi:phosphate-selective porin OprO/OprP
MKLNALTASISAASLSLAAATSAGTVTSDGADLVLKTKGGFEVSTVDKQYSFRVGGRLQYDYNKSDLDGGTTTAEDKIEDQFDVRRARIFVSGDIQDWSYKAQFNIGDDDGGDAEDLYVRYKGFGKMATITAGKQKMPFGLEELTSSKDISMLERSAITEAYAIGRQEGVQLSGKGNNFTYAIAGFETGGDANEDDFGAAARVTFAPVVSDSTVVHLGLAYKDVEDGMSAYGLELAGVLGPFHAQAEFVDADNGDGASDTDGYYLQAGWVITGEQRPYKDGKFKRIKPADKNGAIELVARYENGDGNYSDIELDNDGDSLDDATAWGLGLNWYVNNNVKLGMNYTEGESDTSDEEGEEFRARVQIVF